MSLTYIRMSRGGFTQGQPGGRRPCLLFVLQSVITWRNEEKIPPANKRETEKKRARRMARVPKARRRRKLEIHGKELQGVEHLDREEDQGHHPLRIHSFGHHYRHELRPQATHLPTSQPSLIFVPLFSAIPRSGFGLSFREFGFCVMLMGFCMFI
jgi:hypothetical protein